MLAYYDSLRGLAKCRVISAHRTEGISGWRIKVRITARNHPIYSCGEIVESNGLHVIPRDKVRRYRGQYFARILPYDWSDYLTE